VIESMAAVGTGVIGIMWTTFILTRRDGTM
jgi:hypothetical protein